MKGRFSEREGIVQPKGIQLNDIDEPLKNLLWNVLNHVLLQRVDIVRTDDTLFIQKFYIPLMLNFFHLPIDKRPGKLTESKYQMEFIRDWYFDEERNWFEIYDLIDFLIPHFNKTYIFEDMVRLLNSFLEKQVSGYRVIGESLTKVTDDTEMESITQAIAEGNKSEPVRAQLNSALEKLSRRDKPDFRGSIKDSISAVETKVNQINGTPKSTLGFALKKIGIDIPPAFKEAFKKLYGFTSDAGGIRHGLRDGDWKPNFEEAKFMLVACSAFVNYLKSYEAKNLSGGGERAPV